MGCVYRKYMHGVCFLQSAVLVVDQVIFTLIQPYHISQTDPYHPQIKTTIMFIAFVIRVTFVVIE